jgi:hypothetical protein
MANVTLSKKYSLQLSDFWKGALLAVGAAVLTVVQQSLEAGNLKFNWSLISTTAISAFVAYLVKNGVFEPAKTTITTDTNAKAVNVTEKVKEAVK